MLKYLNGKILQSVIPNETTLVIKLARNDIEQAKDLNTVFQEILKEYAKHITTICLIGGEEDQLEMTSLFRAVHKAGLKTGLSTYLTEMSQINLNLLSELDYIQLKTKLFMKDYSPFGDIEDWIEIST